MIFETLQAEREHFFLIAGPCVMEDEEMILQTAEQLKTLCSDRGITLIFKSSYKKANRTSYNSFTGVGLERGLEIFRRVKEELELPVLTDIHETTEVKAVADVADVLQIPAFLARQTDLIVAAAATGRCVNIKKAQFMAPEDMKGAIEKAFSTGNKQILLTERGTSFGYHNLVVDFRNFPILSSFGLPVVYDVTHSLQRPSVGDQSGGNPEFAPALARAALATGYVDGLFIETHPNPVNALSDSATQLPLDKMGDILDQLLTIKVRG